MIIRKGRSFSISADKGVLYVRRLHKLTYDHSALQHVSAKGYGFSARTMKGRFIGDLKDAEEDDEDEDSGKDENLAIKKKSTHSEETVESAGENEDVLPKKADEGQRGKEKGKATDISDYMAEYFGSVSARKNATE